MTGELTPGWRFVSIGFESSPLEIQGVNPWTHDKRWQDCRETITVAHPSYPAERHTMFVYRLEAEGKSIRFACGEFSNGVWGFFAPETGR